MCACVSCKKEETQTEGTTEAITNGSVEDSSAFIPLGMVIDVSQNDMIKDVTYEIKDTEIAVVNFKYNGLQCQFRGSAVHNEFDLAGVQNNGDGNMVVTSVGSYNATYYKLDPGRVVFWSDENIHYSLYVYVTAEDSVLEEILSNLIFENHYTERADVKKSTEAAAEEFAGQVITIIQNKDMQALSEIMNYPQELGSGQSIGNIDELMAIPAEDIFTKDILEAVNEDSLANLRQGRDGDSYLIGSNYKNIYFRKNADGDFKIVKINN
ncbi:hypothetical protein CLOL250_00010 [Clostridium sp. L2-50]|jgi:hypothetical protein|nr:hypothetical protein CLOL250_00010 [Clostridium sp. L2-50]